MTLQIKFFIAVCILLHQIEATSQTLDSTLKFPTFVNKEEVNKGNPYKQWLTLRNLESKYLNSPFRDIYREMEKNFAQFLGFPYAGVEAMSLKTLKRDYGKSVESPGAEFALIPVIDIIKEQGKTKRIILWGEEHHLPQTRSLYKEIIGELWKQGFRYLAAESFTEEIEAEDLKFVNYHHGMYTRDPVFAEAVNYAILLGYKLIAYDNNETERDKVQAETIYKKTFEKDPAAKVLVIAGRSHIVEEKTADGWEPMGYWLKKLSGYDPLTLYAPTMSERLTSEEEHPVYKYVTTKMSLNKISILVDTAHRKYYGNDIYTDAYIFFPRVKPRYNRPDWLFNQLGRRPVAIPAPLVKIKASVLVQAFREGQLPTDIPIDQVVLNDAKELTKLALPPGRFWIRAVDTDGTISRSYNVKVKE